MVVLYSILILLLLLITWLLIAPIVLVVDSEYGGARLLWKGIGSAWIRYDKEWWFSFQVLFFNKKIQLTGKPAQEKTIQQKQKTSKTQKDLHPKKRKISLQKMINLLFTFRIEAWKVAIDTGDVATNAQWYALNFQRGLYHHLYINFENKNSFYLRISNVAWRMLYAFIK